MSRTHSGSPRAEQFAQKKQIAISPSLPRVTAKVPVSRKSRTPTDGTGTTTVFEEEDFDGTRRTPSDDVGSYNS